MIYALLEKLFTTFLTQKAVAESKICKTLKTFSQTDLKTSKEKGIFPLSEYKKSIDKSKIVYKRLSDILKGVLVLPEPKKEVNKPLAKPKSKKIPQINIFSGWKESYTSYVERLPYLNGLAKQIIYNL